jgi:glycosyltransferase involved in cell wall biosynthesis
MTLTKSQGPQAGHGIHRYAVGVSVAICCHNSAERLPETVAHLKCQQVRSDIDWEVIVIDNASTDDTSTVARQCWGDDGPVAMRVVNERRLGLSHARVRALLEARYELVSFIDDDNWVAPNWVEAVSEIMSLRPDVGACFGKKDSVCEGTAPWWFKQFEGQFVIGPDLNEARDFTDRPNDIPGAGLTIRKSAWIPLHESGFEFLGTGRCGRKLLGGEDTELVYALKFCRWRLWYDPRLRLRHFLPVRRLRWQYLRDCHYGFGISTVHLDSYYFTDDGDGSLASRSLKEMRHTWTWQIVAVLQELIRADRRTVLLSRFARLEGEAEVLKVEGLLGRLSGLLRARSRHDESIERVRNAGWRKPRSLDMTHSAETGYTAGSPPMSAGISRG